MCYIGAVELCEYHCKQCGKLLCKGHLTSKDNILEVKCRGCHSLCTFTGNDADIIRLRSALIRNGGIPDPEKD